MKIGVALGGGGAKGLAHVVMLEALDELGIRPVHIAGTSIGAVAGVIYCSGFSGKELREVISTVTISEEDSWKDVIKKKQIFKWLDFISPQFDGTGLLKTEKFLSFLFDEIGPRTFEELPIPLTVVAADFWSREEVVLDQGELLPAIKASMALPGVFPPVVLGDRVLIDGGAVNPVPFDLLSPDCDFTIAIDVIGSRTAGVDRVPSLTDVIFNAYQIMEKSIIREKLKCSMPSIYIEPDISGIRVLEFYKADQIFKQALPAKEMLKREMEKLMEVAEGSNNLETDRS
jgi:NTE family protein